MEELSELIKTGQNEALKARLEASPDLAKQEAMQGISLLQFAAYCMNADAVKLLRTYVSEINLFEAASIGDTAWVEKQLSIHPGAINTFSSDGFTALGLASFFGQPEVVEILLSNGADPNIAASNAMGVFPIHSACATSQYEIASKLIAAGAKLNVKQRNAVTPLHSAAHNGQAALVQLLLDNGADRSALTDDGISPEAMAREAGFETVADLLK